VIEGNACEVHAPAESEATAEDRSEAFVAVVLAAVEAAV